MGINSNEEYIADELTEKGKNKIPLNEIELSANKSNNKLKLQKSC